MADITNPQDLLARIREQDFYLRKPRPAILRPWAWVLVSFPLFSTIGLAILAFFGFGFAATGSIPNQADMTLWAAGCLALGEVGSFFAAVEVFRKYRRKEAQWWDWVAVILSALTTAVAVVVGWAWTIGGVELWQIYVQYNSAAIMAILAVLDTTLAGSEAGLYLGEEAEELKAYQEKYAKWAKEQEFTLRKFNKLIIDAERAYFDTQLRQWESENITAPVEYVPQLEDKILTVEVEPEYNGLAERCWCGMVFPEGKYVQHLDLVHVPEVIECENGVAALKALKAKYTANRNFPTKEGLDRWLRENR